MRRISQRNVAILLAVAVVLVASGLLWVATGGVTATQAVLLIQFAVVVALTVRMRQIVRQQSQRDKRIAATLQQLGNAQHQGLEEQSRKLDQLLAGRGRARQDAELRHQANRDAWRELRSSVAGLAKEHGQQREALRDVARRLHDQDRAEKKLWRERSDALIRQVEALHNLHRLVDVRADVPHSRGWALSPDALLTVVADVLRNNPSCIVECGSGTSSVWLGYAAEAAGGCTRVVCLEHDPAFARETRRRLAEHGLEAYVDVRDAALVDQELEGETWPWYDPAAWSSVTGVDLLLVDGPPEGTQALARYPAVPLFHSRMSTDARVLLDDTRRSDEQEVVHRWLTSFPDLTATDLLHEKGAILLTRSSGTAPSRHSADGR